MREFLFLAALAAAFPLQAQTLNRNLIVNAGAEDGDAVQSPSDPQVRNIPGWTTTGGFSVGLYGGADLLSLSDAGPVDRGKKHFFGGPGTQRSTASQTIDLNATASEIDAGRVKFYLSGYLGYLSGLRENARLINLKAEFQDVSGTTVLQSAVTGPAVDELNIPEGLLLRTASGFLPSTVRKVKVTLDLAALEGAYNSNAADNLSLVLTTEAMLGVNLLVNGNGDTDPRSDDGAPVPGWTADSAFAVWKWGDYKLPKPSDPGPEDRGKYFFACPTNRSQCKVSQTIDIGTARKLVDAGRMTYQLSGWLGGDYDTPDNASLNVTYYDAAGAVVSGGSVNVGPVTQQERNNQLGMWQRTGSGTVPSGARRAAVSLIFHRLRTDPENLAAYADSIVFVLDAMQVTTVVNAASSQGGAVSAGEFVSIYGSNLGPAKAAVSTGMEKALGGVKVTFNGIEAFMTYASATQINALVPYGVKEKADVAVQYGGASADAFPLALADSAPGIFTQQYGAGQAWAVNNDYQFNAAAKPVARGGWVSFWATGQGAVDPAGQDGEVLSVWKSLKLPVKVTVGGVEAPVIWAGLIYTGEIQVNATIPSNAPTGDVELILTVGNVSSRKGVTLAVK